MSNIEVLFTCLYTYFCSLFCCVHAELSSCCLHTVFVHFCCLHTELLFTVVFTRAFLHFLLSVEISTVFLSPSSFLNPFEHLSEEETKRSIQSYLAYLKDDTRLITNPGLKVIVSFFNFNVSLNRQNIHLFIKFFFHFFFSHSYKIKFIQFVKYHCNL